jgi:dihydroorotate dehydrogenase
MYRIIKFILFRFNPELAHKLTFNTLHILFAFPFGKQIISSIFNFKSPELEKKLMGLHFKNPVGLAAGFDKDAKHIEILDSLGFGFIEIGTITPKPQPGNEKPRLFRLPKDEAIINRMGFNNEGVDAAYERLLKIRKKQIIVGGNIGKNKITPNEEALNDYIICFEKLFDVVDYFVVNVSSPNTPGLRTLQEKEPLLNILNGLQKLNYQKKNPKPILLKIAPDLTNQQLDDIVEIVLASKIAGVIATNTTITRDNLSSLKSEVENIGMGGLSGKPVKDLSTHVIKYVADKSNNQFLIIGVGGIHSPEDALEKLNAGAELVQLYTGYIYEGPSLVKRINKAILNK